MNLTNDTRVQLNFTIGDLLTLISPNFTCGAKIQMIKLFREKGVMVPPNGDGGAVKLDLAQAKQVADLVYTITDQTPNQTEIDLRNQVRGLQEDLNTAHSRSQDVDNHTIANLKADLKACREGFQVECSSYRSEVDEKDETIHLLKRALKAVL